MAVFEQDLYGYGLHKLYSRRQVNKGAHLWHRLRCSKAQGLWENRTFSKADDGQVHEAPRYKVPISEACLVQQQQCRALIHSTICRALVCHPMQIDNGFRGKLTDGHGGNLLRVFTPSSVITGYLRFSETTCIFSQASWLLVRTKCMSLQWCSQHWACFSLNASHLCAKDCTVQKFTAMMPLRGDMVLITNAQDWVQGILNIF